MIDDVEIPTYGDQPQAPSPPEAPGNGRGGGPPREPPGRRRSALAPAPPPGQAPRQEAAAAADPARPGHLAVVSTVFGMMMAVASDLPQIENRQQYQTAANSYLYDDHWHLIGLFAPPNHEVIDQFEQISWAMRRAIVSARGPALLERSGGRPARHRSRGGGRRDRRLATGGVDDRTAVRQERPGRAGQPHGVREAARGGAGLPPHAPLAQGADPHRVPELDLLRQRRLRSRIRGARVLRQGPRLSIRRDALGTERVRLWRPAASLVRLDAHSAGGGAACRHGG